MSSVYENLPEILQYIGDIVFITDTGGRVMDYNHLWERLLGYPIEDVIGHHLSDFWMNHRECTEILSWLVSDMGFYVSNIEAQFKKKNGGETFLSLTLSKLKDSDGKPHGVIGIGSDITDKKKAEAAFRTIHQELENFIYTISHDLKSPVLSIEGYSSILIRDYRDRLDDKGIHYLERIQYNINKMGRLLKDLLEISRSGRVIGEVTEVDTGEVVSTTLSEMEQQIKNRNIRVVRAADFPIVVCDRYRLIQVFENILSNAIKFMGDQLEPVIEIGYQDNKGYHEFFVKDNGIGIDPRYHKKVFGIFQRLEEVQTEGTGVGLTIAKRIVENHGGRIWIASEPGTGTTFYFTLPAGKR